MIDPKFVIWAMVLASLILWTLIKVKNYIRSVILALKLPGPPALPVFGNVLTVKNTKDMVQIANNVSQKYAPMFRVWIFVVPFILIYEPEHLKIVLTGAKLSTKNIFYRAMHTFVGGGLITSNGHKWKKNRKLIQPHFQINLIENYFDSFAEGAQYMVKALSGKTSVKITEIINTCVLNVLYKTVLGVTLKPGEQTPFRRGELLVIKRLLKPWLLLDSVFKLYEMSKKESRHANELHGYIKKVLEERKRLDPKDIKNTCLLDTFIELSNTSDFSEEDIFNESATFMLAGQDSVGAGLAFCLYYLAKHQDVQEKVFNEINDIICEDDLKTIKIEQLNKMIYLEQCIKETMRLAPSIPIVSRILTADVTLGKHTIPQGTNIFISPLATHRLPHIFPDPLKFDPDRFSPENVKKMHPFSFLPFSAGPRNCIGFKFAYFEMKTIVAILIKNYHIALKPGCEDISVAYRVTWRTKRGLWLDIKPRNKSIIVD